MIFVLIGLTALVVVVIGLVIVGRETNRLATRARPAVFELTEAVAFIADALPVDVASRISHDDVRWVLMTDVELLEDATVDAERLEEGTEVVDEEAAVARILAAADAQGRDISDEDIAAVLDARTRYLEAIGAVGPVADPAELVVPDEPFTD